VALAVREGWQVTALARQDDESFVLGAGADRLVVDLSGPEHDAVLDAAALQAISDVTGGAAYVARDPRRVGDIMLDAFGRRPCEPGC